MTSPGLAMMLLLAGAALVAAAPAAMNPTDLGSPDPGVRERARLAALAAGDTAVEGLIRVLTGDSTVAACAAADCLGRIGVSEARPPLHAALAGGSLPLRCAAAAAIARMGDFRDVGPLAAALEAIPVDAARALARLGETRGIEPLEKALPGLEGAGRVEILAALVRLGRREFTEGLIEVLAAGGATGARARLRLRQVTGADAGNDAEGWRTWWRRRTLSAALASGIPAEIDRFAVQASKGSELEEGETLFRDLLILAAGTSAAGTSAAGTSAAWAVRTRAILTLGLAGDRRAYETLLRVLEGPAGAPRVYAAEALGRLGDPRAIVPLTLRLLAPDPDRNKGRRTYSGPDPYFIVDVEICKALVRLGLRGGLRMAIENLFGEWYIRYYHESLFLLRDVTGQDFEYYPDASREDRREAAMRWLRWFREHRREIDLAPAIDFTDARLMADVDDLVSRLGLYKFLTSDTARRALMIIGEPARPRVERALAENPSTFVRTYAAEILGELGDPASVEVLARSLSKDASSGIRTSSAEALGRIGPVAGARAVAALRAALLTADETPDVRTSAAEALGLISDDGADARLLAEVAAGAGAPFRLAAARAMLRIGDARGGSRLLAFLASSEETERRRAVAVLREVTGHDLGFDPTGEPSGRAAAIARWRAALDRPAAVLPRRARGYVRVTALTDR